MQAAPPGGQYGKGCFFMANAPKKFRLPSSGLGRTLLSLLITAAVGLVYFYITLPALNLHDSQF